MGWGGGHSRLDDTVRLCGLVVAGPGGLPVCLLVFVAGFGVVSSGFSAWADVGLGYVGFGLL